MRRQWSFYLLALSFALGAASNVLGQEPFTKIDFPGAIDTRCWGINPRGDIVGSYVSTNQVTYGFLLGGGSFTTIEFPGATSTEAFGINPRGDIVGRYVDASGRHGYLLSGDSFSKIDVPGATFTGAAAINSEGDIVGRYQSADGVFHGFLLSRQESKDGR